jgi:hypothetical protein
MRQLLVITALFLSTYLLAQDSIKIKQGNSIPKKGFHLQLKNVYDDSRCPEGVTCIWAGEVSVTIVVYKNKKLVEEKKLTLNSKNKEANSKWFSNYLPKNPKEIDVSPYPKQGQTINPQKYYIKIIY